MLELTGLVERIEAREASLVRIGCRIKQTEQQIFEVYKTTKRIPEPFERLHAVLYQLYNATATHLLHLRRKLDYLRTTTL